jgi:hypothetical protein
MAVIQPPLEIPTDIAMRLLTGELVRKGGVVRDRATGRLVKLLDDATPGSDAQQVAHASVAKALANPRSTVVALSALAVVAVAGGITFWAVTKKRAARSNVPVCVEEYRSALAAYLEGARTGRLDSGIIERLIVALDAINEQAENGNIVVEFSLEQSETLVAIVAEHTKKLAAANQVELTEFEEAGAASHGGMIIEFRRYLEMQERIFSGAA